MAKKNKKNKKTRSKGNKASKIVEFEDLDGNTRTLTPKQFGFAKAYVTESNFNATQAVYDGGYNASNANSASSIGKNNLDKDDIKAFINKKLHEMGMTEETVDIEHLHAIKQNSQWNAKVAAIREYNKMHGRHAPEKQEGEIKIVIDE